MASDQRYRQSDFIRRISFLFGGDFNLFAWQRFRAKSLCAKVEVCSNDFWTGNIAGNDPVRIFYIGLSHTTGAKASIINASNAFFAIIIAHFLLQNEKITWRKCIGCFVGFAGVIVMNLVPGALGDGFSWNGEGFVLLCSIAYGASSVTLKKIGHLETSTTITAFQLLFGGAVLILIGWICGGQIHGFTIRAIVLLIYMAALSAVAFSIWTALLQHHLVGKIAIYGFSIPVFGVVLSGLLLGETMVNLFNLLALVLVSVGIIVVNRTPGKQTAN